MERSGDVMARSLFLLLFCRLFLLVSTEAEELPIRIDSSRNGAVYVQRVGLGKGFELLSASTPATILAKPGERVDVRVSSVELVFFRWEGQRQNLAAPANVTIRLEKSVAWDRVALVGTGLFVVLVGFLFRFRRRVQIEASVAHSQIVQLEQRAADAEMVGSLAKTLGDYEVLGKLGSGAMGVVYKVQNSGGDIFAAKVPNEMDERVRREAKVSSELKSPHIVECFGLVEGEQSFLLLEYMDGRTVDDWLEENQSLSLGQIDDLVRQLLEALAVAHSRGVYHRDIKPENLFLAQEEEKTVLKVMDFGLASSLTEARLTRTGEAMGTPLYASPEQLSGNPIDATSDLYSVGVFIFELATGQLPWNQLDPVALTLKKYKPLDTEPIERRPDLPMAWNQLVVDLLSGDPAQRPQSVPALMARWTDGCKQIRL